MIASRRLKSALLRWSLPAALLWSLPAQAAELLMFERGGCVWCERWNQAVGPVYDKTAEATRLPLRRIHVDQQMSAGATLASRVVYTPTFVVVDDGAEVGRITGYIDDHAFWGLLGTLVAKLEPPRPPDTRSAKYLSTIPAAH